MEKIFTTHIVCRLNHDIEGVVRFRVPNYYVPWSVPYPEYNPPDYTSKNATGKDWTDPVLNNQNIYLPEWLKNDKTVNRGSESGYEFIDGRPCNPAGRTGMKGRGVLGRWGANHSVVALLTRMKRERSGDFYVNPFTKRRVIQFVGVFDNINEVWTIPFCMLASGEEVNKGLQRAFILNTFTNNASDNVIEGVVMMQTLVMNFFDDDDGDEGHVLYKGYIDDGRNTDNAWVETVCKNYHDHKCIFSDNQNTNNFNGTNANVEWKNIDKSLPVRSSQIHLLKMAAEFHKAHW